MKLNGKKILLIGGSNYADEIKEYCDKKGVRIVVTGIGEITPLKRIADEVYDVDTSDFASLCKLTETTKVDGIFAGGNETNIVVAIRVSEKLGLPYYCTMDQWQALMNKGNFKRLCKEFGLQVTEEYICDGSTLPNNVRYPVIIKPVDSCGSKGVLYCENEKQLIDAVSESLKFSASKCVLVEKYVTGTEISATYTICNGNITLSCMKEKYPVAEQTGLMNMPNAFMYPSKHLGLYMKTVNDKVIAMLRSLDLRFGTLFIQGFVNGEDILFFEAGYRPGGTNDFRYTDMMNGVNHMHMLIEQALTGEVNDDPNSRDNPFFPQYCCSFTMCARGGKISCIEGLDEIADLKEIRNVEQFYHVGDDLPCGQTLAQRALRFFILSPSLERTEEVINKIQDTVHVEDADGKSVLYGRFNTKRFYKKALGNKQK